jgi:hypothetical protein
MIILVSREVNLIFVTKLLCFDYVLDIYCAMEVAMLRQAFRQTVIYSSRKLLLQISLLIPV